MCVGDKLVLADEQVAVRELFWNDKVHGHSMKIHNMLCAVVELVGGEEYEDEQRLNCSD